MVKGTIKLSFVKADLDGPAHIPEPKVANVIKSSIKSTGERWGPEPTARQQNSTYSIHRARRYLGACIFTEDDDTQTIWGADTEILWLKGEPLVIAEPMGLGIMGRTDIVISYLAMDRTRRIKHSLRRQFSAAEHECLDRQLIVRPGPPLLDLTTETTLLVRTMRQYNADIVILNSLKDAVIGLSADETEATFGCARQHVSADGRNICELHHTIKRTPAGGQPLAPPTSTGQDG